VLGCAIGSMVQCRAASAEQACPTSPARIHDRWESRHLLESSDCELEMWRSPGLQALHQAANS
jgi:hypothetical protein